MLKNKNKYYDDGFGVAPSHPVIDRFEQHSTYFGGGKSGSDTSTFTSSLMQRKGSTNVSSRRQLPGTLSALTETAITNAPTIDSQARGAFSSIIDQTQRGGEALGSAADVDVYSDAYTSDTEDAFTQRVNDMLAQARSGEQNALAPISRGQSFRESEVIRRLAADRGEQLRQERIADAGIQQAAANQITQGTQAAGEALMNSPNVHNDVLIKLAELVGSKSASTTENLSGWGSQSSSGQSIGYEAGGNLSSACCWIFLESYYGKLPWYVRSCRDQFAPENSARRRGYRRMAKWLVPMMREHKWCRLAVWLLMVKPMSDWGAFYKGVGSKVHGRVFRPLVSFWFKVWEVLGWQR